MNISCLKTDTKSFRYERKFVISAVDRYAVESIIRHHPACFSQIYHERSVNNIYLDWLNMASYLDNESGAVQRLKIRIRWYNQLFGMIEGPVLELKLKHAQLGTKMLFLLAPFRFDADFSFNSIRDVFRRSDIPDNVRETLMLLQATLLICYRRKYFQSADRKYRLTLDWDMEYYRMNNVHNTFSMKKFDRLNTVLEVKYSDENDDAARAIVSYFPFELCRNSKYIAGIEGLLY